MNMELTGILLHWLSFWETPESLPIYFFRKKKLAESEKSAARQCSMSSPPLSNWHCINYNAKEDKVMTAYPEKEKTATLYAIAV